jgi:hypothetical protein
VAYRANVKVASLAYVVAVYWHGSLAEIVKEHQDQKTTGRYAHLVDRAQNNPAAAVPVSL